MSDSLTFGGISTPSYDVFISGAESYNAPERDQTMVTIPGRSGDLVIDNGRYLNIIVHYPAFIRDSFRDRRDALVRAFETLKGYQRLTSTYDPDHFRMGVFCGAGEFATGPFNRSAKFTLRFNCKPQRFRLTGETQTTMSASGTITNPTGNYALPLVRVYGSGTVTINGTAVTVSQVGSYIDIDSDLQECYEGTANRNNNVTLTEFPKLKPGSNTVTLGSGITQIKITPRWYDL